MKAREIMTFKPETVVPGDAVSRASEVMKTLDVGALPVVADRSEMRLVGIVTDRDLVIRHLAEGHGEDCSVGQHMTEREEPTDLATARPEDTVEYVMELMKRNQVRRIPIVTDGDERLEGIIALADVARELGSRDPADVVEVLDEISEPARDGMPVPEGARPGAV